MSDNRIGAWWLGSIPAQPGEEVLFSALANRTQASYRAVGGKLFATNHRLVFLPHWFDRALGGEGLEIPLRTVTGIGDRPAGGDTFGGGLRNRLTITHTGGEELFVVNKLPELVAELRRIVPGAAGTDPH